MAHRCCPPSWWWPSPVWLATHDLLDAPSPARQPGLWLLAGLSLATQWQLHALTALAMLMVLLAGQELVEGVLDLLAARTWLAAQRGPGRLA